MSYGTMPSRCGLFLPAIPPPPAAVAGGCSKLFLWDDFWGNSVDLSQVHSGFNWYWDNNQYYAPSWNLILGSAGYFSTANSILSISSNVGGLSGQGSQTMSFHYTGASGPGYLNQLPLLIGNQGFYVEAKLQFLLPANGSAVNDYIPDFWLQDVAGTVAQIRGAGSFTFPEIDVLQGRSVNNGGPIQDIGEWTDWQHATFGYPAGGNALLGLDYTKYHTWGALLTPMSKGGGTGSIKFYVDGVQNGAALTWTAGTFGSSMDAGKFQINFGAGQSLPLNVDYIGAWI